MAKVLRARVLFPLTLVSALGVWVACGGSDAQDVVRPQDSGTAPVRDSAPVAPDPEPEPIRDAAPDVVVRDAGRPIILDGGAEFEGGIPCYEGGELELEPNDLPATANRLAPIRCGAVIMPDGADPDAGDTDTMTFTIGDASTGFFLSYEGQVRILVDTDGQAPVDITLPNQNLPLVRNQPYYARIRSKDGKTQLWKLVLFENK